ncbi:MAG: hypothetical protein GPJ54_08235 [Candidatus Heimdallarchaeota archaeon]|nr:hypothetical protein [Candidatus Heimdallarchaeota archaeon]
MSEITGDELDEIKLHDFLDLSVSELLILYYLQRTTEPILRFELLEEINALIGPEKQLHASSFYLKLDKLESKKLIKYIRSGKKKLLVVANPISKSVLNQINKFTYFAKLDTFQSLRSFAPNIQKRVKFNSEGSLLIISFEDQLDRRKINLLVSQVKEGYILAEDAPFKRFTARSKDTTIYQTKIHNDNIREAENFFDTCVIQGYGKNVKFSGYDGYHWLTEAIRVLKVGGHCVVISISDIPETGHIIADSVLNELRNSNMLSPMTYDELSAELEKSDLIDIQVIEHRAVLIGIGKKAK